MSEDRYWCATHKYLYTDEAKTELIDSLCVEGWTDEPPIHPLKVERFNDGIGARIPLTELDEYLRESVKLERQAIARVIHQYRHTYTNRAEQLQLLFKLGEMLQRGERP